VICELLGVPYAERSQFARWGATVGATIDRVTSVRQAHQLDRTVVELNRFFGDLIELRSREPGEGRTCSARSWWPKSRWSGATSWPPACCCSSRASRPP
jgi:hypothetical protein